MIRYNSRPLQCLHDRMLRKARNNCREPAEVPFRACYSGPLRGPYPASFASTTYRSHEGTCIFTLCWTGTVFYPSEFLCNVQRRPASKSGGGWGRRVIGDQPDRPHKLKPARKGASAGTITPVPRPAKHSLPLAKP